MKKWPGWLVVLAAACGFGTNPEPGSTTLKTGQTATADIVRSNALVVRVIDGDTIDASFRGKNERIRLIGVDTPETKKPNTPIQCWGPEASAFTKHTLPEGTPVMIVRDLEARDDYGRLLGYVYRSSDGLFVNLELAVEGFAKPLTITPNDAHAAEFISAARAAEASDLGLWGACRG